MDGDIYSSKTVTLRKAEFGKDESIGLVTLENVRASYNFPPEIPFARNMAKHNQVNAIHVLPDGPRWYQYPDRADWLEVLKRKCSSETLAFGSSMGGYAVAQFSDFLGLKRGLCFSPQFSIRPDIAPGQQYWRRFAEKIEFLYEDEKLKRKNLLWVFYDPFDNDAHHAQKIAETGPCELIEVPHAGHPVGTCLRENGSLHRLEEMFLRGEENRAEIEELILDVPLKSSTYHVTVGRRSKGRDRLRSFKLAMKIDANNPVARQFYGFELLEHGSISLAEDVLKPAVAYRPDIAAAYKKLCERLEIKPNLV